MPGPKVPWLTAWLVVVSAIGARAQSDAEIFFESKIRPLFARHCHACHSDQSGKAKGGLTLDTHAGRQKGGDNGKAIIAGDVEKSPLIAAVRYADPDFQMPPSGKISVAEIADLEKWIKDGAFDPREPDAAATSQRTTETPVRVDHWAFKTPIRPTIPEVANHAWATNEIDRFILAGIEAQGIRPAPRADRRTLIRRATQDLHGVWPTIDEVTAFERDESPDAWTKVIDRLLASPRYGERQARRWLDLVRYADSNGLDENLALGNAWRYRDWVVGAFNDDMPYDRFVTEQIAGDLLPPSDDEKKDFSRWTAGGLFVLGPKMLAEQDKQKLTADVVDENIDVLSKTVMGLTIACARCHDHKFDPIATRDYYALAGILRSTATMENLAFVSRWKQRELATKAEIAQRDAWRAKREKVEKSLRESGEIADRRLRSAAVSRIGRFLVAAERLGRRAVCLEAEEASRTNLLTDRDQFGTADATFARTGSGGKQFAEYDVTVPSGSRWALDVRMAAEESRPMRLLVNGQVVAEAALGAVTGSWRPDGLTWVLAAEFDLLPGRNVVRFERDGSIPHLDALVLRPTPDESAEPMDGALARELTDNFLLLLVRGSRTKDPMFELWRSVAVHDGDDFSSRAEKTVAELRERRESGSLPGLRVLGAVLDGPTPRSLDDWAQRFQTVFSMIADKAKRRLESGKTDGFSDPEEERVRKFLTEPSGPLHFSLAMKESLYAEADRAAVVEARQKLADLDRRRPPDFPKVLAVADGEIKDSPVFIRGNHLTPGKESVPRGFPKILTDVCPGESPSAKSSGRLELAKWLFDPAHPLTARVAVNRLWQGHFGRGIVASASNFGLRGDPPSDPALLDWLATRLIDRKWSLKAMHREIMTSSTYMQSAFTDAAAVAKDPANSRFGRQKRRRLEAEELRDSALALSEELDWTMGGTLLMVGDGDYVTNDQSADAARYSSPRRSIYLPIVRNSLYDLYQTFDYNDAGVHIESRPETTVANQALYLLHAPLFVDAAATLATRAEKEAPADDGARIEWIYRRIFQRSPTAEEAKLADDFVRRIVAEESEARTVPTAGGTPPEPADANRKKAWSSLVHVLLMSADANYVE